LTKAPSRRKAPPCFGRHHEDPHRLRPAPRPILRLFRRDPRTPPADLPDLPPLGQRRCANLPAGASSDPAAKGPFAVGVRTIDLSDPLRPGRTLTTEIWYPADASVAGQDGAAYSVEISDIAAMMGVDLPFSLGAIELVKTDAVRDAPRAPADPAAGLVVFSHGFRGIRVQSTFLTVYLASHGYVVAAPDHQGNTIFDGSATPEQSAKDRVEDFSFVTREMVVRARDPGDFFAGAFDVRRISWTGHSFGASMSILAGSVDNREILSVPLAPAFDDRMALVYNPPSYDLRAALFVVGGTADTTTLPADQQLAYDRTVAPRYRVALDQAKHMDFTDVCANDFLRLIPQIGDGCGPDTKNMHGYRSGCGSDIRRHSPAERDSRRVIRRRLAVAPFRGEHESGLLAIVGG